tara:strand:- start:8824 stop:8979 length:156 start_codon:yes stop_codon:yes gene_type:complete
LTDRFHINFLQLLERLGDPAHKDAYEGSTLNKQLQMRKDSQLCEDGLYVRR